MNKPRQSDFFGVGDISADYDAAKNTKWRPRMSGLPSMGAGADWHFKTEATFLAMIEESRGHDRSNMVLSQGIDRAVNGVHRKRFAHEPDTGDKKLDADLWQRFEDWASDEDQCDLNGERDLGTIARESLRHSWVDGSIINLPMREGQIQSVEAHRLRGASRGDWKNTLGIVCNNFGKPIRYLITKADLGFGASSIKINELQEYPARDERGNLQVFHLFPRKRVSQHRGVPITLPIFDCLGIHDSLQLAQLIKAQAAAAICIFEEVAAGVQPLPGRKGVKVGEESTETTNDGNDKLIQKIGLGLKLTGQPGSKLTGFAPAIPNQEFFEHVNLVLTFVAINLGIPVHALLLDPTKTNFSGWRGAMDLAREGFMVWQDWLIAKFYKPIYRWKIRQWMDDDDILKRAAERTRKIRVFNCEWRPPSWGYIEPLKDAQAIALRLATGQASRRRIGQEYGFDSDVEDVNMIDDNAAGIMYAMQKRDELNDKYDNNDDRVSWRDLFKNGTAQGITMQGVIGEPGGNETPEDAAQPKDKKPNAGK